MPRHLFQYQFVCIHEGCQGTLMNDGVHQKTRMVLDISDYYVMAGEGYECNTCKRHIISWSQGILKQLDHSERSKFPCILTEKYACDLRVARLMRQRTLGNSSSLACKQIAENHGETYLDKCRQYADSYLAFKQAAARGLVTIPAFVEPPAPQNLPRHRWFMKVYQLDVISRLDFELAELTSTFGEILKIDSTKKITNKLAGKILLWL
ncbi:hypothetical protein DPMN_104212 [Dreissena polymorpha]|uniref:DUF6729 domain-containing protein n=1 Tax=Dreissena polymorpha TaxID=45954 RepID=A0A9D4HB65_DREPO|nr:hypothetical protein DPMN_104212 [Dreissena polymorpha]